VVLTLSKHIHKSQCKASLGAVKTLTPDAIFYSVLRTNFRFSSRTRIFLDR